MNIISTFFSRFIPRQSLNQPGLSAYSNGSQGARVTEMATTRNDSNPGRIEIVRSSETPQTGPETAEDYDPTDYLCTMYDI